MKPGELPMKPGELPMKPGELPMKPGELPMKPGELPMKRGEIPTWRGEIPTWRGEIPTWRGEIPTWRGEGAGSLRAPPRPQSRDSLSPLRTEDRTRAVRRARSRVADESCAGAARLARPQPLDAVVGRASGTRFSSHRRHEAERERPKQGKNSGSHRTSPFLKLLEGQLPWLPFF
jgi:hypothetical protein